MSTIREIPLGHHIKLPEVEAELTLDQLKRQAGNGKLFALWVNNIKRLTQVENQDFCIGITGYEGSGKSTLALLLDLCFEFNLQPEQICFDADGLLEVVTNSPPGSVAHYDEAVNGLYAREAMSIDNRILTTAGMVARARNLIWILLIPDMHNLDPYFREHRIRNWIDITRRGEALFHVKKSNPYYPGVFWQPFLRLQYDGIKGAVWEAYDLRKKLYIQEKLIAVADRKAKKEAKKK